MEMVAKHSFEVVLQETGELALWRAELTVKIDQLTHAIIDYKMEIPEKIQVLARPLHSRQ